MIPEPKTKKAAKRWLLDELWYIPCPHGHVTIPADELTWHHHGDSTGMSVDCPDWKRDFAECDYCFHLIQHLALKETMRLTKEYLEWFMWGPDGTRKRETNRFQTVGAERALALAVLRRT